MNIEIEIRVTFEYEFRRDINVYRQYAISYAYIYASYAYISSERIECIWLNEFHYENFSPSKFHGQPKTKVATLYEKPITDFSQATSELAAAFNISDKTIIICLRQIKFLEMPRKYNINESQ